MTTKNNLSDEEILELWKDEKFPGHFSGVNSFQAALKYIKGVIISKQHIRKLLHTIPNYQTHVKTKNKGPRRPYVVNRFGELAQGDLAVMWEDEGYSYFVLVVDVYSMNIYTRPLKTKLASEMKKALEDIFINDFQLYPEKFETDQGGEFQAKLMKKYYREKKIFYKVKIGQNKASVAENGIKTIKRKLYMALRQNITDSWVDFLPTINEALNAQPRPALGYMTPAQVSCPEAGPILERAKKMHHVPKKEEPSVEEMIQNQSDFESANSPYQVGKYVYKNYLPQAFDKSFDTQVTALLHIYALSTNHPIA